MFKKDFQTLKHDIERKEYKWAIEKDILLRQINIQNEKKEILKKKLPSTTKLLIFFLFGSCTCIELFTGWCEIRMLKIALLTGSSIDFSPLVALIGAIIGQVFGFGIYAAKSTKENTNGGIVYDIAMKEDNSDAVG